MERAPLNIITLSWPVGIGMGGMTDDSPRALVNVWTLSSIVCAEQNPPAKPSQPFFMLEPLSEILLCTAA